jgi:aspartyl-tRNA(Asn)/glutamyl-tRNA(Gln) amidotransferase subunit A
VAAQLILASEAFAYHREELRTRWRDYTRGARSIVALGALVSGGDYVQAQRVRNMIRRRLAATFEDVDLVVTPTMGAVAPRLEQIYGGMGDPSRAMGLLFTSYWDITGHPVLAVPIGGNGRGLPLSMQLVARPFEEAAALRAGHAYQQATTWHRDMPTLEEAR